MAAAQPTPINTEFVAVAWSQYVNTINPVSMLSPITISAATYTKSLTRSRGFRKDLLGNGPSPASAIIFEIFL